MTVVFIRATMDMAVLWKQGNGLSTSIAYLTHGFTVYSGWFQNTGSGTQTKVSDLSEYAAVPGLGAQCAARLSQYDSHNYTVTIRKVHSGRRFRSTHHKDLSQHTVFTISCAVSCL